MEVSMSITAWLIGQCILMFIGGQALHLFLIKVPAIKTRARAANKQFIFKEWWECDWNIIIATQIIGALCIIGLNELAQWNPTILAYVRWFFAGIGAFGSTVAMSKFSQYEKELTRVLDIKSNIADVVTGGTKTVKDTIQKGHDATGQDVTKHDAVK
jgi:hypothetical protein